MHVAPFLGHEEIQKKKESEVQQNAGEIYKKNEKTSGRASIIYHCLYGCWLECFMIFCKYKNKVSSYTN